MADYKNYLVDPWQGAKEAQATEQQSRIMRMNQQNADRSNALAQRGMDFNEKQTQYRNSLGERQMLANDRQNRLSNENTQLSMNDKKTDLLRKQADVVGRALDTVKDEQSYRSFMSFIGGLANSPLGQSDVVKWVMSNAPQQYDPQKIEQGKQIINSLRDQQPTSQLTGEARNLQIMSGGKVPSIEDYKSFKESSRPQTTVMNKMPEQEKEYDKKVGGHYADQYVDIVKTGNDAQVNKVRLSNAKTLAMKINTGATKPTTNSIKAVVKDLGFDLKNLGLGDDVGLAQALNAVSLDLTMDAVQRTKGAVSDKEMALFAKMAPGLSNTVEGNLLIIDMANQLNSNKIKVAQMARDYTRKNKRFDDGFYDELDKFYEKNPLFTPEMMDKVQKLSGATEEAQGRGMMTGAQTDYTKMTDDDLKKQLGIQ